ncbi:hypothetical protein RCL_jg9358.t1 [Rhizophagus clarus]|uniref:Uncharacterized protein n=1 Tax=Rhizophagus clarus TaxID=94130 RepID=A0A8H3R1D7_9GLOM|nr:hypothetical protein RCL_jg9358.t1 [Rhizophagus clarus]
MKNNGIMYFLNISEISKGILLLFVQRLSITQYIKLEINFRPSLLILVMVETLIKKEQEVQNIYDELDVRLNMCVIIKRAFNLDRSQ